MNPNSSEGLPMFPGMMGTPPPEVIEKLKQLYPNGPPKTMEEMMKLPPPPPEIMAMLIGKAPGAEGKKPQAPATMAPPVIEKSKVNVTTPTAQPKMAQPKMGPPPAEALATLKKFYPNGPPRSQEEMMKMGPPPPEVMEALKQLGAAGMMGPGMMGPPPPVAQMENMKIDTSGMKTPPAGPPSFFMDMIKYGVRPPKGVLKGEERKIKEDEMEKMKETNDYTYANKFPDDDGYFGIYGGICDHDMDVTPEQMTILMQTQVDIKRMLSEYIFTEEFNRDLNEIRKDFQGRPTPLYECKNIQKLINNGKCGRIFLKREDLNHTGAHKINHCMAQGLIAKKLGKTCLIAGTGAGQHGLAVATAAAYFGMDCKIFMGSKDVIKEHPNVSKMRVLGAEVISIDVEGKSLKEANDACIKYYVEHPENAFQCIGSVVAVSPWPFLIRQFQRCIGDEAREQLLEKVGKLPDHVVACIGGGSNSIGTFSAFIDEKDIKLYPVEPMGRGTKFGEHSACLRFGQQGVLHGSYSYILKNEKDEFLSHSVASGLCYPSVGPEHALLKDITRTTPVGADDKEALEAFFILSKKEGIIPALESAHAVVQAIKLAKEYPDSIILCNLSGRGDKDVDYVMENFPEYSTLKEYDLLK